MLRETLPIQVSDDTQVNNNGDWKLSGYQTEAKLEEGGHEVENDTPVEVTNNLKEAKHDDSEREADSDSLIEVKRRNFDIKHQKATRSFIVVNIVLQLIILLSSSSGSTADFTKSPQNVAVLQSNKVIFNCSTTLGSASWVAEDAQRGHHSIFYGHELNPAYSQHYEVTNAVSGPFDLTVKQAVKETAMKFSCAERPNQLRSAELIVIESEPECQGTIYVDSENATITCVVNYWGNWPPAMKWTSSNEGNMFTQCALLQTISNPTAKFALNVSRGNSDRNYTCTTEFKSTCYKGTASASNVPIYHHECTVLVKKSESPGSPGPDIPTIFCLAIGATVFVSFLPEMGFVVYERKSSSQVQKDNKTNKQRQPNDSSEEDNCLE